METFRSSRLIIVTHNRDRKSKLIFNFLKEVCSKLLKDGSSSSILYHGILKRIILSKEIGLVVGFSGMQSTVILLYGLLIYVKIVLK